MELDRLRQGGNEEGSKGERVAVFSSGGLELASRIRNVKLQEAVDYVPCRSEVPTVDDNFSTMGERADLEGHVWMPLG
jgi:hypothetical protein